MPQANYDMSKDWIIAKQNVPPEIVSFLNESFYIVEIRRRAGEIKGITFEVRSREQNHSLPHVHASYGEYSISITIEDGKVLSGNLPKKHEKTAVAWVLANKEKLLSDWKSFTMSATSMLTQSLLNTGFDND